VNDFARYYGLPEGDHVGIEREEFDRAYRQLHEAGIPLLARDRAWQNFATIRSTYASRLNLMARYWRIPLAQWVGDRIIPRSTSRTRPSRSSRRDDRTLDSELEELDPTIVRYCRQKRDVRS
jgi:hypothetical protein